MSKKVDWAAIDAERAQAWPVSVKNRWDEMILLSGWRREDGPTAGVWTGREYGHRCISSCKWSTYGGLLEAQAFATIDALPVLNLIWEGRDLLEANRAGQHTARLARAVISFYDDGAHRTPSSFIRELERILSELRPAYAEYTAAWNPPGRNGNSPSFGGRLMMLAPRPSWATKAQLLQQVGG